MKTKTLETQIEAISTQAPAPALRDARRLSLHQVAHQGDVYLHRVSEDHPRGAELGTKQVAIGDTKGSRHVVVGPVQVFAGLLLPPRFVAPDWLDGAAPEDIFLGPVVVVAAGEEAVLTHPEHAHHNLCGTYQVTYQADARARARVRD
jgi:hypothetical protein